MPDKDSKKRLRSAYKESSRTQSGGVYLIRNTKNGKIFLDIAPDIAAVENRFHFSRQTDTCVNAKLRTDWALYGSRAFEFEIAEIIDKNADQSPAEFREDLELLKNMWIGKIDPSMLY